MTDAARRLRQSAAAAIVAALIFATGFATGQVRAHDPSWVAPPDAASKPNPLANQPAAEAGGRKLFQQRCAECHGQDGKGTTKAPDLTLPDVQNQSDGALFWKMSHGNARKGMPTFSYLPEAQRWQLVLRLRALREGATGR